MRLKNFLVIGLAVLGLCVRKAAAAAERPRITGIADVTLKVSDFERSRKYYEGFLGYGELPGKPDAAILTIKVNDDQYLRLVSGLKAEEPRLAQISYVVSDAEAMRAFLAGQKMDVPSTVALDENGNKRFAVPGPEGLPVGFVEYLPGSRTSEARGKFMPETRIAPHIRHAGFCVIDVAAAMKFYHDMLGFQETWRGNGTGAKTISWITFRVPEGEQYVEFGLYATLPPVLRRGVGNHISLDVPDMVKAVAELEKRDYAAVNKPITFRVGVDNRRNLGLYDPDGTRSELLETATVDGLPMPVSALPLPEPGRAATATQANASAPAAAKPAFPAGVISPTGITHTLLVHSPGQGKDYKIAANGDIAGEFKGGAKGEDCWLLADGRVLSSNNGGVKEMDAAGAVTWEYKAGPGVEVHSCQPVDGGRVLICECGSKRLFEINRDLTVAWEIKLESTQDTHKQFRLARKTEAGTYLVAYGSDAVVRELDATGNVLKTFVLPARKNAGANGGFRLPNGNTLVTGGYGVEVYEFDKEAKIIWTLGQADLPAGFNLHYLGTAQRLASGNIVLSNFGGQPQVFEVTPEKKVVWQYYNEKIGDISGCMVVEAKP